MSKAREFWIRPSKHGESDEIYPCDIKNQSLIHVREVLPNEIIDTEMLDFVIENRIWIQNYHNRFSVIYPHVSNLDGQYFDSPREAIRAAMKEQLNGKID